MSDFKIGDDGRRRATDQLEALRRANDDRVAWDTEAPADFTYLYDPDHLLVRARDAQDLEAALTRLKEVFDGRAERTDDPLPGELARYRLPPRSRGESLPEVLDRLDQDPEFRPGRVTPDHWIHITPTAAAPAARPPNPRRPDSWSRGRRCAAIAAGARACGSSSWTPAGTRRQRPTGAPRG